MRTLCLDSPLKFPSLAMMASLSLCPSRFACWCGWKGCALCALCALCVCCQHFAHLQPHTHTHTHAKSLSPSHCAMQEDGHETPVTFFNKHDYVQRYVRHYLYGRCEPSFDAFKQGFLTVCQGTRCYARL